MNLLHEYGNIHRIPHWIQTREGRVNFPGIVRSSWLESTGSDVPFFHICGELSSLKVIRQAIKRRRKLRIAIGDKILNKKNRAELAECVRNHPDLIEVYSVSRPDEIHGTRIGDNLLIEERHDRGKPFLFAKAIEHANPELIRAYDDYFQEITKHVPKLTPEEILKIQVINGSSD